MLRGRDSSVHPESPRKIDSESPKRGHQRREPSNDDENQCRLDRVREAGGTNLSNNTFEQSHHDVVDGQTDTDPQAQHDAGLP